jgi:hypothetical protein
LDQSRYEVEFEAPDRPVLVIRQLRTQGARLYDRVVGLATLVCGLVVLGIYVQIVIVPALAGNPTDLLSLLIISVLFLPVGASMAVGGVRMLLRVPVVEKVDREPITNRVMETLDDYDPGLAARVRAALGPLESELPDR